MKMNKKVILSAIILLGVIITVSFAGPFGFFGRGSGSCSNGSCSIPESNKVVVPTPKPKPQPVDNIILDCKNCKQNKSTKLETCDCKQCNCILCVCKDCKCEDCPGKTKHDILNTPSPVKTQTVQQDECEQPVQQYEYYERPRLFRRIFRR